MKPIVSVFGKLNRWKAAPVFLLLGAMGAIALPAQTFTTLHSFDGTDGANPYAGLVQATNGDLYGTTALGGSGNGTVFKITAGGTLTTAHSFDVTDGAVPVAGLVQAMDGYLYGTTEGGGEGPLAGGGVVFKMTPGGTVTTVGNFCDLDCQAGTQLLVGVVEGNDGDFYGATSEWAAYDYGSIFKVTSSGTVTTLYTICPNNHGMGCPDGTFASQLIQAADGNFYGTMVGAGLYEGGTVFKITPSGVLTTIYSFCPQFNCADGSQPYAGLVQAPNGDFYGTTYSGGANNDGTIFKVTPTGTLTTLYSFCSQSGCADGSSPITELVQASDGNFYGTTYLGGAGYGTIFKITPGGMLTTLYSFCSQSGCPDGESPSGLLQDTNGKFYGTTRTGGANGDGTVYSLSVGLGPFVKTRPAYGAVGKVIEILGTDLTGATTVSFNGTAASFTVVSRSLITTTVPTGATTGKVEVTTPKGTLSTRNVSFRVRP